MSLCTSYFNSQLNSHLLITYGHLLKIIMKLLHSLIDSCYFSELFTVLWSIYCVLEKFSLSVFHFRFLGLDFSKDGKFMALAERRNCKDFISIFSCDSWQLLKVRSLVFSFFSFNKLTSVCYVSVLLLMMIFVITLSK